MQIGLYIISPMIFERFHISQKDVRTRTHSYGLKKVLYADKLKVLYGDKLKVLEKCCIKPYNVNV